MEPRKLTKEDIDKVRDIEGFPIGTDEDIIALSNAPYYTACPNPFIEEFIRENGTPYDESTDDYHCEPFAVDISEGKYAPLYKLHSYPTKVPYKAIMHYILHYTKPGDIVFDGFCGTGMTGVAAQLCSMDELTAVAEGFSKGEIDNLGERKVILSDLSPTATFISSCYNQKKNVNRIYERMQEFLSDCEKKYGWMYRFGEGNEINYTVWSKRCICPNCGKTFNVWDRTMSYDFEKAIGKVIIQPKCDNCGINLDVAKCESEKNVFEYNGEIRSVPRYEPVLVNYQSNGKRYEKVSDGEIFSVIEEINNMKFEYWFPHNLMMNKEGQWGDYYRAGYHQGIKYVDDFMTKRTLMIYGYLFERIREEQDAAFRNDLMFICTACFNRTTRMVRYMAQYKEKNVGPLSGTLYMSPIFGEINVLSNIRDRLNKWKDAFSACSHLLQVSDNVRITTQSTAGLKLPDNSIDYIFIDPPFGDNLIYSELNHLTDSWLKVTENIKDETIVSFTQFKDNEAYKQLMRNSLANMYKALKPNRWITIEFHNSKNAIWNIIQSAVTSTGFIIADVRTLDKKKATTKQMYYTSAVKQDLVISAYKPKESFERDFRLKVGTEETAWLFVRQHLENIPVVIISNGRIEIIAERQAFLLFDRMVAYHIMNGIPVPMDAADFYCGLDEKFLKRDGMYFLADQVNEYDTARIKTDVEPIQFSLFVTNEKTAISWLYQQLDEPQTYAEIQPKFMQEVKSVDKFEAMPELAILLEENFLQDENGRWYIPDITKEGDVAKLREKKLWKEFEGYMSSKGKLKLFRSEAIRVGFSKLWKDKNYQAIVDLAERLPEKTIQEDSNLLMYYDISLSRV
jgi:DNA modification methylase